MPELGLSIASDDLIFFRLLQEQLVLLGRTLIT